jgi:hypothetical protein
MVGICQWTIVVRGWRESTGCKWPRMSRELVLCGSRQGMEVNVKLRLHI